MNHRRDQLISQVKTAYSGLADWESRGDFVNQSNIQISAERHYENQLEDVIHDIKSGKYDQVGPEFNIIEYLANHKGKVQRIQDSIAGTRNNMEIANDMSVEAYNEKTIRELLNDNKRRIKALESFEKDLAEAKAEKEL